MDRLVTDILGPLPISEQGNRYILLVGDQFSKWMEAYAIPDQTAETVSHKIVYEFISRFGTPLIYTQTKAETMNLICSVLFVSC